MVGHRVTQVERKARLVARHVAADLGLPVVAIGRRHPGAAGAIVAVPETAMDEEGSLRGGEDEIRLAGEIVAIEAEAKTCCVSRLAHDEFGRRVLRLHRAHHGGALFGIEDVSHQML